MELLVLLAAMLIIAGALMPVRAAAVLKAVFRLVRLRARRRAKRAFRFPLRLPWWFGGGS